MKYKGLEKAAEAMQARKDAGEVIHIRTKREVFNEKNTRKSAIDLFCVECMGGEGNTGYRADIRACTCGPESKLPCSLYEWRPYK
jgi:hypothetical protein